MTLLVIGGRPGPAYNIVASDVALHMSSSGVEGSNICSSTLDRSIHLLKFSRKTGSGIGSRQMILSLVDMFDAVT